MLTPGATAPSFSLLDHTGTTVQSQELSGHRYVLWFYPVADTPGWTKQGNGFRDRIQDYETRGVRVFGVSVDSVEKNCAFAEKFHFNFPLLCDTEKELALAYGAMASAKDEYAQRYTFVVGPDGKVEQAIATTDPAGQAADLLDILPDSN